MDTLDERLLNQQIDNPLEEDASSEKDPGVEDEDTSTLVAIEQPFDPKRIDIESRALILDSVIKRLRASPPEIDLYPDFQRKDDIWNKKKQSQLIESVLIRLPLPAFYFDASDDNKWLVVDGLQRLSTLKNFVIDQTLVLENMEFLSHLDGKRFNDLPREFQRRIEESPIVAYLIKPGTPEDVKYNIFKRINTGGEPLTLQEIRHALNQGTPAKFIAKLASIEEFKIATGYINPDRMLDRDFVNRFVSFYLIPYQEYKSDPNLDTFLNKGMRKLKEPGIDLIKMEYDFSEAMKAAYAIFGKHAFRKQFNWDQKGRKPLNKALFEVWSVSLAKLSDEERRKLIARKRILCESIFNLIDTDKEFYPSISQGTGDRRMVIKRFSTIEKLIQQILNPYVEATTN